MRKMVTKITNSIIIENEEDIYNFEILTKKLLKIYPVMMLIKIIENCVEEKADEDWKEGERK